MVGAMMTAIRFDAATAAKRCYGQWWRNATHGGQGHPAWDEITQHERDRLTRNSQHAYDDGYATGLRIYADDDHAALSYGQARYRQRGELSCGAYERGIADALTERLGRGKV